MVTVGIVAQRDNERAHRLARSLLEVCISRDVAVRVDEATGSVLEAPAVPVSAMSDCTFVVCIGGDGTFLFVARETEGVPLVGINLGEVGFLNAVSPPDSIEAIETLLETARSTGEITGRQVDRVQAEGEDWTLPSALNEVVVHGPRRGPAGGATLEVAIDGTTYATGHGDGILVSTPTGSTAYNLSEGGPLLMPNVDGLVVTQMAAEASMPPLVVDPDATITLEIRDADQGWAISDGRNRQPLTPPATVEVSLAADPLTIAGPDVDFFDALEKLE